MPGFDEGNPVQGKDCLVVRVYCQRLWQTYSQSQEVAETRARVMGGRVKRVAKGEKKGVLGQRLWKHGIRKGKKEVLRKGNKLGVSQPRNKKAKFGTSSEKEGNGGKKWGTGYFSPNKGKRKRKGGVRGGRWRSWNKNGKSAKKKTKKGGKKATSKGKIILQPRLKHPEKTAINHLGIPTLGELSGLQQFKRKIMAQLDVVKADVKNIVAIAQAKKMVAATASTIST